MASGGDAFVNDRDASRLSALSFYCFAVEQALCADHHVPRLLVAQRREQYLTRYQLLRQRFLQTNGRRQTGQVLLGN